ncbi:hypothetical protein [Catenulispora rubra]|uniref:hypothetical protein n=1 Tax=Catenulispora rubra TaxID=280293 RepID=UPI0018924DD5|nr:hypothetical protein [Catenulispora rubra]
MGILCDYFAAADDATAAAALDVVGRPGGPGGRLSEHGFQVVSTKDFSPFADVATVEVALTGEIWEDVWDRRPRPVAMRDEGERLVVPIAEAACAALVAATGPALKAAAVALVRSVALPGRALADTAPIVSLLTELRALARGASERGERVYCWLCV